MVKRVCQQFAAFTAGPPELYAEREIAAPPPRTEREYPPRRTRHPVMMIAAINVLA
jgi:hypothetical protein